jgi:hypothetical protein
VLLTAGLNSPSGSLINWDWQLWILGISSEWIMAEIQTLWKQHVWPIKSGIAFADDRTIPIGVAMPWESDDSKIHIETCPAIQMADLPQFQRKEFTQLISVRELANPALGLTAVAGEGSHGSEGFVALTESKTGKLVWLAYCDCCNPFKEALIIDGFVVALSNLGHRWHFPLNEPQKVFVEENEK